MRKVHSSKTILLAIFTVVIIGIENLPAPVRQRLDANPQNNIFPHPTAWKFSAPFSPFLHPDSFNLQTKAIKYYLGTPTYSAENEKFELDAIRSALHQWESIPDSNIKFEEAGILDANLDINLLDGKNLIYWENESVFVWGGTANIRNLPAVNVSSWDTNGTILESDTVFNGIDFKWRHNPDNLGRRTLVIDGIALHEIGHFLGLTHSVAGGATMYYQSAFGDNLLKGLSMDEILFARQVYTDPSAISKFGTVKGTLTVNGIVAPSAKVIIENTKGYLMGATVTEEDGSWEIGGLLPGEYTIRYNSFPPKSTFRQDSPHLIEDIDYRFEGFNTTQFSPTSAENIQLTGGQILTHNKSLNPGSPKFIISQIRPVEDHPGGPFSFTTGPVSTTAGQTDIYIGLYGNDIPTEGATLRTSHPDILYHESEILRKAVLNMNMITRRITIPEGIDPGLLSFIIDYEGEQVYVDGFFEISDPEFDGNFDGVPDDYQRKYFSPFTTPTAAAQQDPDNDGFPNIYEYRSDTDPTDPDSFKFLIKEIEVSENGTLIKWESIPNRAYNIWSRQDAGQGDWKLVASNFLATEDISQFLDPSQNEQLQFYRVEKIN